MTILDQPLHYPPSDKTPLITTSRITIAPGSALPTHSHSIPLWGYVIEGELTVDYGTRGKRIYKPNEAFMEATDWPQSGINAGREPVILLAVYMGAVGVPLSEPAEPQ